jgi:predicted GNAT family N-acyltransferase
LFEGLTFRVAKGLDRPRAMELLRHVYVEAYGHVPNDGLDEQAHFLVVALADGQLAATVRVLGPEQRPFDLESSVPLSQFVSGDRCIAEIGRLCIRTDYRSIRKSTFIQFGMLKLAYAFARKRGITDFVMYTYPELIDFYRRALFELVDVTFTHPDWGDVHVMRLDLLSLETRFSGSDTPLGRILFSSDMSNFIV